MIIYAAVPLIAKIYKVLPKEENNQIIYEGSSWHDNDKIDLKKKNSLINLPYLKYFKYGKLIKLFFFFKSILSLSCHELPSYII